MEDSIETSFREERVKLIKTIHHLIHLLIESSKIFVFVPVALMVCVSHVFVYDAVGINKIVIISSIKLPLYVYVQVTKGLKLYPG